MMEDVNDWENKLTIAQKDFLTNIFRFFTQGDVDIANAYYTQYLPFFKLPEVTFMLGAFADREGTHILAYSHLIETIGMPESTYSEFLSYNEMKAKKDYIEKYANSRHLIGKQNLSIEDKEHLAIGIALFSGFNEGMQLFSTFAMLLIFPLNGLMKGMGQILTWSIVDETQHVEGMKELFKTFLSENKDIRMNVVESEIKKIAIEMVDLERSFIDLIFDKYDENEFFGLTPSKLKLYIEYIADYRLNCMGFKSIYNSSNTNPLPELNVMINAPIHTNFFENTSTDYSIASSTGEWSDIWN
jgi:ribonucleoside-diphosphate reductase beta chain